MVIAGLRTVSKAQNGVGAFILQCRKLDFHYCDWAGSSRGMNEFLKTQLSAFATRNPGIEINVSPRPRHHPVIRGTYMNGKERAICVKNHTPQEIAEKLDLLRSASGEKPKRERRPVKSLNESVRGVWDPYHGFVHKV